MAAHGTGTSTGTVEEQIVRMKLATPGEGLLTLSADSNPHLFSLAKVGLGSLGVVTELTLRCIPLVRLSETTSCMQRSAIAAEHISRLCDFRHVRYMWIPYTDTVVTVCSNPLDSTQTPLSVGSTFSQYFSSPATVVRKNPTAEMISLLQKTRGVPASAPDGAQEASDRHLEKLSVADLRSELLESLPLDLQVSPAQPFVHVIVVQHAVLVAC